MFGLFGKKDKFDIKNYNRFKNLPKTGNTHILYRGDTRSPDLVKQEGGFFPQEGVGKSNVSESGGSTGMVCLTLLASVGATYYSVRKYFNAKFPPGSDERGYIYAVYLPAGRGILNYEMAAAVGSNNLGSQEISTLCVPWSNVLGWRKLLKQDECKCPGGEYHFVNWYSDFELNEDFKSDLSVISLESREALMEYMMADDVLIWNSNKI